MRRDGDSEAMLDETYAVPANSCDDLADGVQVEDVFPEGGTYEIRVEPEGRTTVTESVRKPSRITTRALTSKSEPTR